MYKRNTVAVVVPAYNEAGFIGSVLRTIPEFVDRIYAIDDRSTDDTWREIKVTANALNDQRARHELPEHATDGGRRFRRVVPIRHDTNEGVGGALKTGYKRAYEDGMDVTAVMAGDGQMDPDYLEDLINPIVDGKADYVKGNRFLHSTSREEMPQFRLFGNWLLSLLTKFASGYWGIGDPQNGYTAISREALSALDLDALYDRYGFANELLARLNSHDLRVADVATPAVYGDEQSSIQYHTFIPTLSTLLVKLFFWRLTVKYVTRGGFSVVLLYLLCLGSFVAAGLTALWSLGTSGGNTRLTILCLVTGAIALGGAVHVERARSTDLELQVTPSADGES